MIAGRLNQRIRVFGPVFSGTGSGAELASYVDRGLIHAERVRMSGLEANEAGEIFADYRAGFRVRMAHAVGEKWQVEADGVRYSVVTVVPDRCRGLKTLNCERVNL